MEIESDMTGDWCERLYREKSAALVLYGRALGLSHGEAEDVLQETFIALLALPSRPEQPPYYCLRAFRNRALNHRRSLWRRLTRELESRRWFDVSEDESARERAALHCLKSLPPDQREVIILKIWHRHTFEAIGELLDISPNTVAGRYRYGLQKLRACLTGEHYERLGKAIEFVEAAPSIG
jgi:RNA polymerase sigma-70 factor (ECF subfamily)